MRTTLFTFAGVTPLLYMTLATTARPEARSVQTGPWIYSSAQPGLAVKPGTELRILCVGDSITAGDSSDRHAPGDWNGYRKRMRDMLSEDKVVFAGTVKYGSMDDGWTSAWPGRTIQYMHDNIAPALAQHPNLVLVHAGTNDMSSISTTSTEGNDPAAAAGRLGSLIDSITTALPEAVVLVAIILSTCRAQNIDRTKQFQGLIQGVVQARQVMGRKVVAVDLRDFPVVGVLEDCIHPDNAGYELLGSWWYDFVTQVPRDWIVTPEGPPPDRSGDGTGDTGSQSNNASSSQGQGVDKPSLGSRPVSLWAGSFGTYTVAVAIAVAVHRGGELLGLLELIPY